MREREEEIEYRDPRLWPFSQTSIWNMPIGSDAEYVHARLEYGSRMGLGRDEEFIMMKSDAPPVNVYYSDALWHTDRGRCQCFASLFGFFQKFSGKNLSLQPIIVF